MKLNRKPAIVLSILLAIVFPIGVFNYLVYGSFISTCVENEKTVTLAQPISLTLLDDVAILPHFATQKDMHCAPHAYNTDGRIGTPHEQRSILPHDTKLHIISVGSLTSKGLINRGFGGPDKKYFIVQDQSGRAFTIYDYQLSMEHIRFATEDNHILSHNDVKSILKEYGFTFIYGY